MKLKVLLLMTFFTTTVAFADVWEYLKITNTKDNLTVEKLNLLGTDCWELVECPVDTFKLGHKVYLEEASFNPYAYSAANYCIFKRKTTRSGKAVCP